MNCAETIKQRAAEYMEQVEVGDIFYSMWGYDQTNVDFYQVVKKTAKMITLRPIEAESTETGPWQYEKVPKPGVFRTGYDLVPEQGKRFKMQGYSDRPMVSLTSFADAYLWDGKPLSATSWA